MWRPLLNGIRLNVAGLFWENEVASHSPSPTWENVI